MLQQIKKWLWKIFTCNGKFFTKKHTSAATEVRTTLKQSDDTDVNVIQLLQALGSVTNIQNVKATINTLSIFINNWDLVSMETLQTLGTKGLMRSGPKLTIVFGDDSAAIAQAIQTQMNLQLENKANLNETKNH